MAGTFTCTIAVFSLRVSNRLLKGGMVKYA